MARARCFQLQEAVDVLELDRRMAQALRSWMRIVAE